MMKRREFIQSSGGTLAVAGVPTLLRGKNLNSAIQLAAIGTEAARLGRFGGHGEPCKNPTGCLLRRRPQPDLEGEEAQPGGARLPGLPRDVGEGRGQDRCGHDRHSRSHACHRDPRRLAAQKTRLLSEALDPYGLGSEAGRFAGGKIGRDHTHGQPDPFPRVLPHGSGARTIGCNWKSKTGSFLDQCDGAW